jgi:hypothetical protein
VKPPRKMLTAASVTRSSGPSSAQECSNTARMLCWRLGRSPA